MAPSGELGSAYVDGRADTRARELPAFERCLRDVKHAAVDAHREFHETRLFADARANPFLRPRLLPDWLHRVKAWNRLERDINRRFHFEAFTSRYSMILNVESNVTWTRGWIPPPAWTVDLPVNCTGSGRNNE